jgi:hypothetical protein
MPKPVASLKSNKTFTRILMVVLFCIWGGVGYQVYDTVTRMDADDSPGAKSTTVRKNHEPYQYRADVPDPFRRQMAARSRGSSGKPLVKVPQPVWVPPPLMLTGILTHPRKATAVLLGPDGSTFFASPGDTLLGAKILKITQGAVAYVYNKKKAEWVLP